MGKFVASVKGGLHANYSSVLASVEPYNTSNNHRIAAQALSDKGQFEFREIVETLAETGVGTLAQANYYEIEPNVELGGKRNVIATPLINRNVTANDLADVKETLTSLSSDTYTPLPVYNGDRNPLGTR